MAAENIALHATTKRTTTAGLTSSTAQNFVTGVDCCDPSFGIPSRTSSQAECQDRVDQEDMLSPGLVSNVHAECSNREVRIEQLLRNSVLYHGNVSSSQPHVLREQRCLCSASAQVLLRSAHPIYKLAINHQLLTRGPKTPLLPPRSPKSVIGGAGRDAQLMTDGQSRSE
jgi:hypothetical protein